MSVSKNLKAHAFFWVTVLFLLAIFEFLVQFRLLSPASYATPLESLSAGLDLINEGILVDIAITARRALLGFVLGFPLGVLGAVGIYSLRQARSSGELLLDFVRSIPITATVPLFIAIYGIGEANKIAIGAASAFLVTIVAVWIGFKESLAEKNVVITIYRPGYWKQLWLVILPHSLPTITAGMRLAVSSSLVLVVVAEMFIGTRNGLGKIINDLSYGDNRPGQFAAIVFAGLLGYLFNVCFERLRVMTLEYFEYEH